jgi:hypothetical protein
MQLTWVYDHTAGSNIGHPNLSLMEAEPFTKEWHEFGQHWPWVIPFRFLMYLDHNHISYRVEQTQWAENGWYPIGLNWFDFDIDYFSLIPEVTRDRAKQGKFKILFYYHEGDNPSRISSRLVELATAHGLLDRFIFVSANTAAENYFDDHECFFRYVNRNQSPRKQIDSIPEHDFTLLNRVNKWWRLSCVTDLWREGLLENSLWSYDTSVKIIDSDIDNPISIKTVPGWEKATGEFLSSGPYICDDLDRAQKNDHRYVNEELYSRSCFHVVMETHFDADQSDGTFLTEKTWKCIKYAQPFVIVGPAGTLQHLRDLGYRVFDSVLDNSYDGISDPTERWLAIKKLLQDIKSSKIKDLYRRCLHDVEWNRYWFSQRQWLALEPMIRLLK